MNWCLFPVLTLIIIINGFLATRLLSRDVHENGFPGNRASLPRCPWQWVSWRPGFPPMIIFTSPGVNLKADIKQDIDSIQSKLIWNFKHCVSSIMPYWNCFIVDQMITVSCCHQIVPHRRRSGILYCILVCRFVRYYNLIVPHRRRSGLLDSIRDCQFVQHYNMIVPHRRKSGILYSIRVDWFVRHLYVIIIWLSHAVGEAGYYIVFGSVGLCNIIIWLFHTAGKAGCYIFESVGLYIIIT